MTAQAARTFQQAHGLAVDGTVGRQTYPALIVTVQIGSQGPAVTAAQTLLSAQGQPVTVDGNVGPQTDGAVLAFQQTHGLVVDGVIGPQTWKALLAGQ